jgi:hypothetical protein
MGFQPPKEFQLLLINGLGLEVGPPSVKSSECSRIAIMMENSKYTAPTHHEMKYSYLIIKIKNKN